ncbi:MULTISPECIES: PilZ domain-containing protein [Pseudomonas]|uniref:Cyclic diguanosine monophosphate-binding protein n=1 Tax=Pseudomonas monsensis TaxID=2745509 RepID=A0ABT3YUR1_9PSED|nr:MULTISPECIES: PilZ domain-containing protein [Pseudomonas]PTT59908.1 PilZ domain-containing protein [Pseudomonas sp. HMWF007]PTT86539.1 PilZ domain-containing protein [Pseudomonas sp. HMWF005]MCY0109222.1 PilZ domain-containing protein [Pseudomonas monsensis]PTT01772.1 PilZ domain-containing protein [Pseudomonas sp. HMWF006]QXH99794.1 PilZ domain-containing protein [Pseudomonas monsensis]
MSEHPANRRRFKRIAFDARTELSQGQFIWPVKLIDLSLKGLLIERPEPWLGNAEQDFFVDIHLSDDVDIQMDVHLAHEDQGQLGFVCRHIGLESIQRLRRLIELNLADEAELERELGALIEI